MIENPDAGGLWKISIGKNQFSRNYSLKQEQGRGMRISFNHNNN